MLMISMQALPSAMAQKNVVRTACASVAPAADGGPEIPSSRGGSPSGVHLFRRVARDRHGDQAGDQEDHAGYQHGRPPAQLRNRQRHNGQEKCAGAVADVEQRESPRLLAVEPVVQDGRAGVEDGPVVGETERQREDDDHLPERLRLPQHDVACERNQQADEHHPPSAEAVHQPSAKGAGQGDRYAPGRRHQ
jgi:hypothetical protein